MEGAMGQPHHRGRGQPLARAPWWWGHLAYLLTPPFHLYIPPKGKNLNTRSIFQKHIVIRRRCRPEIGRLQKLFPAPYQRGESPPEVFFIAMLASGAMSEWSTLDYGSIAVARCLYPLPFA
jgi:hypothetical protein